MALATYNYTLIDNDTAYEVTCNNIAEATEAIIPSSYNDLPVTSIGRQAFSGCSGLTSVTIPDSITSIGDYAFSGCSGLTSITIPDSVATIRYNAFFNCSGLTSVTLSSRITSILDGVFERCSSLTSITIPNNVTSIGNSAFMYCSSLTSITIPDSVTSIGGFAFEYCSSLISITIPDRVTSIGDAAFGRCNNLISVIIGNGITEIGSFAFGDCSGLASITINALTPPTLANTNVFNNTNNCPIYVPMRRLNVYKTATNWNTYADRMQGVVGSDKIIGLDALTVYDEKIKEYIAEHGGGSNTSNETIAIFNVTTFTGEAFLSDLEGYTSIDWGDGTINTSLTHTYDNPGLYICRIKDLTGIGASAFEDCMILEAIIIGDNVTYINHYGQSGAVFGNCTKLKYVHIGAGVEEFGSTFSSNPLESITVSPANAYFAGIGNCLIRKENNELLVGCINSIIPESVKIISNRAFFARKGLKHLVIPDGVTTIKLDAFSWCIDLEDIHIGKGVTSIEGQILRGCKSLEKITIPFIGSSATATTASANTLFGYIFGSGSYEGGTVISQYYSTAYAKYCIPDSLRTVIVTGGDIFAGSFQNCRKITSITLPETATKIEQNAFRSCVGLTELVIPESVTSIGENAFISCTGLEEMTIKATTPPTLANANAFTNTNDCPIYVPEQSVSTYKGAIVWSNIANRIAAILKLIHIEANPTGAGTTDLTKLEVDGIVYDIPSGSGGVDSVNGKTGVVVLDADDVGALPDTTKYGARFEFTIDTTTYILTAQLKDQDGNNLGTAQTIDLPLESVVVNGRYDNATKKVVLTLQSGSTIEFSVADLVSGLQTEITAQNKLNADLVDDTNSTHKFVTAQNKQDWDNKSDFSGSYDDLTDKPTIPTALSQLSDDSTHRTVTDTDKGNWNGKSVVTVSNTGTSTDEVNYITINGVEKKIGGGGTVDYADISDIDSIFETPTAGLSYSLSQDGTFYSVTGKGTATTMDIVIPETYNGLPVQAIAPSAFNQSDITSIVIPKSCKNIYTSAFYGCDELDKVTFMHTANDTLTITQGAFTDANSFMTINHYGNSAVLDYDFLSDDIQDETLINLWKELPDGNVIGISQLAEYNKKVTDYVDDKIGDIDTLLTALNTGTGV